MTNNNNGLMFEQPVLMLGSLNTHIDDRTLNQPDLISAQIFQDYDNQVYTLVHRAHGK